MAMTSMLENLAIDMDNSELMAMVKQFTSFAEELLEAKVVDILVSYQ